MALRSAKIWKKPKLFVPLILGVVFAAVAFGFWWHSNEADTTTPVREPIIEAIYGLGKVKALRHFDVKLGVLSTATEVYVEEGQNVRRNEALIRFEGGTIRTPFAGTVTQLDVSPGETVVPQISVLRVEDLSQIYVEVALEQQGALRVRPGMKVEMTFDPVRGDRFEGRVDSVYSREDEFLAHIGADRFPPGILTGMTADVVIQVAERENALLVPLSAIREGRVTVVRRGKRVKIPVEVGIVDGSRAEIVGGGLRDSDRVLVPRSDAKPESG